MLLFNLSSCALGFIRLDNAFLNRLVSPRLTVSLRRGIRSPNSCDRGRCSSHAACTRVFSTLTPIISQYLNAACKAPVSCAYTLERDARSAHYLPRTASTLRRRSAALLLLFLFLLAAFLFLDKKRKNSPAYLGAVRCSGERRYYLCRRQRGRRGRKNESCERQ